MDMDGTNHVGDAGLWFRGPCQPSSQDGDVPRTERKNRKNDRSGKSPKEDLSQNGQQDEQLLVN